MSTKNYTPDNWSKYAKYYDPIKCGSIDGTDTDIPHDKAIIRALNSKYKPNFKVTGNPDNTIFIGRLHQKTNADTLKSNFKKFGEICKCRLVKDIVTGVSKCYGFIEFGNYSSARSAVHDMKGVTIDGSEIVIEFECERKLKGWKPRRLGGGFGGQKQSGQLRFGGRAKPFLRPLDAKAPIDVRKSHKVLQII